MPLDPSFIGRVYPPSSPYVVSAAKILEFADAIGDLSPVYRDSAAARAAGYPDVIAPPTFATLVNLRAIGDIVGDPKLGLDWSRVVHAEQGFSHRRPVRAGDALVVVPTIKDIMFRAGNDFLSISTEISTVDGEPVLVASALLVARGADA
ncbi:MAG TPA: MaoC family dehydratase N-terminal domain-containing protein [Pseudonocardiaceae bacterium]|nr:MaoC family dehydratase N-terminal domain-containing protein [Pseudonocardiaceae bacterium]